MGEVNGELKGEEIGRWKERERENKKSKRKKSSILKIIPFFFFSLKNYPISIMV